MGVDRQQAATALSDVVGAVSDPSVVRLGMLNGWAADTAAVEAERAGLVGQEKQTAVIGTLGACWLGLASCSRSSRRAPSGFGNCFV
jgi:hypothetical protein